MIITMIWDSKKQKKKNDMGFEENKEIGVKKKQKRSDF